MKTFVVVVKQFYTIKSEIIESITDILIQIMITFWENKRKLSLI